MMLKAGRSGRVPANGGLYQKLSAMGAPIGIPRCCHGMLKHGKHVTTLDLPFRVRRVALSRLHAQARIVRPVVLRLGHDYLLNRQVSQPS